MNHTPVLLNEVMDFLQPGKGKYFIDATVDGGGHAEAMLKRMSKKALLIGIDRDEVVIKKAEKRFRNDARFHPVAGNFAGIYDIGIRFAKKFDGILFDFGLSSYHLEESGKGFSFLKNEPLDMRFDATHGITAEDIINHWPKEKLSGIIYRYGEERFAGHIAHCIVRERKKKYIKTTFDLVDVIKKAVPARYQRGRIHFATKTFQAIRIAVNDELGAISKGIEGAWKLLGPGGRIVAISFHSLEDRIVKQAFREFAKHTAAVVRTKKPIVPSEKETSFNPRSRSAKLRVIEKTTNN